MAKKRIHAKTKTKAMQVRVAGLDAKVAKVEAGHIRSDLPDFGAGDTVKVHVRIKEGDKERVQIYEGVVIAKSNRGSGKSFTVRKMSHGVGVERIFMESSTKVAKVEIVQSGRVRRAKLYYLRGLEGKAAKLEREVETQAASASREATKSTKAPKPSAK